MNGFTKIAQQMLSQETINSYNQNPFGYGRGFNPQPPPPPTMWDKAHERMGLWSLAGYMIPGVSTVMTGMDTINSLRKGDWGGAAANAAWMAGTLVPGAGYVKALSLANKARRGMSVAGKAVARGAKAMQATPALSSAGRFATPINNAVGAVGQRAGTFSANMANKAQAAQGKIYKYNQFWDNHQRLQKNIGRAGTVGMVATMAPVGYEMYKGIRDSANGPAYSPADRPFMTGPYGKAASEEESLVFKEDPNPVHGGGKTLQAVLGNKEVGYAITQPGRFKPDQYTHLRALYVSPDFRGQGYAREIIKEVIRSNYGKDVTLKPSPFSDKPLSKKQLFELYSRLGAVPYDGKPGRMVFKHQEEKRENKEAQSSSITLGQLIQLIQSDSSISDSQKIMLVYQLKNSGLPSFTSVTPQSAGLLGAAISALVTKYLGFGNVATALSGLGGYAFGSSISKKLNDPYPGYRITGMNQW